MEKEFSKKGSDAHGKDGGVPENKFKSGRRTDLGETIIDFKNIHLLRRFVTDRGKINPARINRLSSKEQRTLATAIKRARHMALLPYCSAHHGMKND